MDISRFVQASHSPPQQRKLFGAAKLRHSALTFELQHNGGLVEVGFSLEVDVHALPEVIVRGGMLHLMLQALIHLRPGLHIAFTGCRKVAHTDDQAHNREDPANRLSERPSTSNDVEEYFHVHSSLVSKENFLGEHVTWNLNRGLITNRRNISTLHVSRISLSGQFARISGEERWMGQRHARFATSSGR